MSDEFSILDSYESNCFWVFVFIMTKKNWRELMKNNTPKLVEMMEEFKIRLK
jgi:hypothetical protein